MFGEFTMGAAVQGSSSNGRSSYNSLEGKISPATSPRAGSGEKSANQIAPNSMISSGMIPLPDGWQAFRNNSNEIYFLNRSTKQETPDDPRPLPNGWTENVRKNGDKLEKFWINNELG